MKRQERGTMRMLQMADAVRYRTMTTRGAARDISARQSFSTRSDQPGLCGSGSRSDGSAVPTQEPLRLPTYDALRAEYFTERREVGIFNIGGTGSVAVNGRTYEIPRLDALCVGRGNEEIVFSSADPTSPAEFYLLSYPAHAVYPTQMVRAAEAEKATIGAPETANQREITRLIHLGGARSCQLVMGFTELAAGSVWNTMPPHTHFRRSEIYLYFNIEPGQRVIHLMGPGNETRSIVVADKQVVVSPGWSIHAGVGTKSYSFCWGMGGENQVLQRYGYPGHRRFEVAERD